MARIAYYRELFKNDLWGRSRMMDFRLSFAGTVEHLNALAAYLWLYAGTDQSGVLYALLLEWIAPDKLPHRPGQSVVK